MNSFISFIVVLLAVGFAIFQNSPAPPQSPLLFQWENNNGHRLQIGDLKIFYKDVTGISNNGPTLLCLHGFPTSSFDYYLVLPALKKIFGRIIFIDFLGFGYSDKPRFHTYSIMEQADIVEKVLDKLGVQETHLLAHDYGDTVAQELLARHDSKSSLKFRLKTVCLLNGGIFPQYHRPRWSQILLRTPFISAVASKFANMFMFRWSLSEVFGPHTKPSVTDINHYWYLSRLNEGYRVFASLLSYIDERREHETRWIDALRNTKVPLHMVYGPADPVNPPPFEKHYRDMIPNPSIYVLPVEIGHYPQLEAPQEFIFSYVHFLRKHGAVAGDTADTIKVTMPEKLVIGETFNE